MSTKTEDEKRARSASEGQTGSPNREQGQGDDKPPGEGYGKKYHGSQAWWSVGESRHQGITHQSVGLSLGQHDGEYSDSLADLYQAVIQRKRQADSKSNDHNRSGGGAKIVSGRQVDIDHWLAEDTSHGFIKVCDSEGDVHARLFPCTLSTSAQKICLKLGIPGNSLHVQLNGDVIRRMEPVDCPLAVQNEYLEGLGYSDIRFIQEEGPKDDLAYLVRFYAGKPLVDYTYSRNQLSAYAFVRKGKLLHQWVRRHCVISGTRLLIHREKGSEPTVVQLAKGSVEEINVKGQSLVLKLTSTLQGERSLYLSFTSNEDYNKWLKKIRKATAKLPSKADLSNCHLEFLPETVFINTELQILILRHNALRERPIEEDIYTIGWLDDLPRFTMLRSLNLANNQLTTFPMSVCGIRSLLELNLASNKLDDLPPQISELVNLQVLHLHNNLLSFLPDEISQMKKLAVIVLAFNQFISIPNVLLQPQHATSMLDSIIMAGNHISHLPVDHLVHMNHIKKIDLRLNKLQLLPIEIAKFQSLEHMTHVDIRENKVKDLDVRAVRCMEYLNCDRNVMRSLQLNGSALKNIFASHNSLQTLSIKPKPEWLVSMNVSWNKLTELPTWLPDCFFLIHLDVSHNLLKVLPERLFTDAQKLKVVKANHNRLTALPEQIHSETLEELHLHHNLIRHLSQNLFIKANRLRYLNVTRNKLSDLPPPNKNNSYNKIQEMYLSFNHLANRALHKICCFRRLRILHIARNKLTVIEETDIEKLEQLTELNISSNNLTYLPASLGRHPKLQVLRASCNLLQELPNFKNSSGLKVLEVSSNHLVNVNMSNLMASQVSLLDISANPSILVKSQDLEAAKTSKRLCMVDMRGQSWSLEDVRGQEEGVDNCHLWQTGLSQTSGIRNKLSVTAVNKPHFNNKGEALFAIFDGGRNDTVARTLRDTIPSLLNEERLRSQIPKNYLKYCMLSAHRNLRSQGQKLGAAAAVVHLYRDDKGQFVLSVANVGDTEVVLCRQGRAYPLSRPFLVTENEEEKSRVVKSGGIITEDGRVAGVTYTTRMIGCSYLYPHVIPEPHVTSTTLTSEDTMFIVASQGLWNYITHDEAIREIKDCPDPIMAAKHLQDLAQGYGSRENISVLVVRLMLSQDERDKVKDLLRVQRKGQKELLKVLIQHGDLLHLRDGVPKTDELNDIIIDKAGHAKKHRISRKHLLNSGQSESPISSKSYSAFERPPNDLIHPNQSSNSHHRRNEDVDFIPESDVKHGILYTKKPVSSQSSLDSGMKQRPTTEIKKKEMERELAQQKDDESKDEDEQIRLHDLDTMKWISLKQKEKSTGSKDLEAQLQQRLTQELVRRELRNALDKDLDSVIVRDSQLGETDKDDNLEKHWKRKTRHSVGGILTRQITKLGKPSPSVDSPGRHEDRDKTIPVVNYVDSQECAVMPMMVNSPEPNYQSSSISTQSDDDIDEDDDLGSNGAITPKGRFNVSPCESVSSIDVRLNNEVDEIYRLCHFGLIQSNSHEMKDFVDVTREKLPANNVGRDQEQQIRPTSPDSLISQDEFVKPPISNVNIDRDALLFHQMQMARAQTHAGSVASLDSIQSAPMHFSNRDLHPDVKTSSHSIEVLVNIGKDNDTNQKGASSNVGSKSVLEDSTHNGRIEWSRTSDISFWDGSSTPTGSWLAHEDSDVNYSKDTYALESLQHVVEIDFHPVQIQFDNDGNISSSGVQVSVSGKDDASDDDRDTLVGDTQDVGQLDSLNGEELLENSRRDKDHYDSIHSTGITVLATKFTKRFKNGSDSNINASDDSDSDDSIGNVSLEDGYDAIEFQNQRINRQSSLSMLNILQCEPEDYPELFMIQQLNKIDGTSKALNESKIKPHSQKNLSDDYEDIDAKQDAPNLKISGNGDDDLYEEIQYGDLSSYQLSPFTANVVSKSNHINGIENQSESDGNDKPTEEDIDALYAKVNKIKMNRIQDSDKEESDVHSSLDNLFSSVAPKSDTNVIKSYDATYLSTSSIQTDSTTLLREVDYFKDNDSDEEREIFISATDFQKSEVVSDLMASNATSSDFDSQSNIKRPFNHPSFPPASLLSSSTSPVHANVLTEVFNTVSQVVMSHLPNDVPQKSGPTLYTSFKPLQSSKPIMFSQNTYPRLKPLSSSPATTNNIQTNLNDLNAASPPQSHSSPSSITQQMQIPPFTPLLQHQSSFHTPPQQIHVHPSRLPIHQSNPSYTHTLEPHILLPRLPPPRQPAQDSSTHQYSQPESDQSSAKPRPPKPEFLATSSKQIPQNGDFSNKSMISHVRNSVTSPKLTQFHSGAPDQPVTRCSEAHSQPNPSILQIDFGKSDDNVDANAVDDGSFFDESVQSGHKLLQYRSVNPSAHLGQIGRQQYSLSPPNDLRSAPSKHTAQRSVIITYL